MGKLEFTDAFIRTAKTDREREDHRDAKAPGLVLRVWGSGRKSWYVEYRTETGRKRLYKLGDYPAVPLASAGRKGDADRVIGARDRARDVIGRASRGEDPQAQRQEARRRDRCETVAELAEEYLERHTRRTKRPRAAKLEESQLRTYVLPRWGRRPIAEISRRDVRRLLEDLATGAIAVKGQPTTWAPRSLRSHLSRMFSWAVDEELLPANPVAGVRLPKPPSRDRVLSEEELRELWRELALLEEEAPLSASALRLQLLTAQRPGEVLGMEWGHLAGEWWILPAASTKSERAHRVPLVPSALAELEKLRRLTGAGRHVFDSPKKPGSPIFSLKTSAALVRARMARRAIEARALSVEDLAERAELSPAEVREALYRAGLIKGKRPPGSRFRGQRAELVGLLERLAGMRRWTPHDLRRSVATHLTSSCRVPRLVVAMLLNHSDASVTSIYDRSSYDVEKRKALLRWERRLSLIVTGQAPAKVVDFGGRPHG